MDMNNMFGFMDLVFFVSACYMGFQWYCMKFKGQIMTGIMLNRDVNVLKCRDKQGYIREASGRMFVMMIACMMAALVGIVNSFVTPVPLAAYLGVMITVVALLFWFGMESKRLHEKYWNDAKKNR